MSTRYQCGTAKRRQDVAASTTINGIDFLEVSPDQKALLVHFLHDLGGFPSIKPDNIAVEGGVRVKDIQVTTANASGSLLTVGVSQPGDFSTYRLVLRTSTTDPTPPSGYDVQLSSVDFSFKAGCPSEFDCLPAQDCPPSGGDDPELDYLAKDYDSFRLLMLNRMAATMPGWQERNPADVGVALVEMLAYVGDQLSYFQDAVATEAYLGTARRRVSVRRHARLLDYRIGEGSSARAWVFFQASAVKVTVPAGTPVSSHHDPGALAAPPVVFETMGDVDVRSAHNQIAIYTWGDESCCLPSGSTRATVVDAGGVALQPGDPLLFEEIMSPATGAAADADPAHRQVVRLTKVAAGKDPLYYNTNIVDVEWDAQDALDFPLCVSALVPDPSNPSGPKVLAQVAVARGNLVLADHGQKVGPEPLVPATVPAVGAYRPQLSRSPLTFRVPQTAAGLKAPAAMATLVDPTAALPDITLVGEGVTWQPQYDLLDSDRLKSEFVVESESDGTVRLRFGDGQHGRRPSPGSSFTATYRIGTGRAGNVGRDVLTEVSLAGVDLVRNPLAASGGSDPEPTEKIKQLAPWAIRTQERAVTAADYAAVVQRHPEVRKAVAGFRWTGSWYSVSVSIERTGGRQLDSFFEADLRRFLNTYRMAGHDVEIVGAIQVPVDLGLSVCVKPGYFRSDVKQGLDEVLGSHPLRGGGAGFFLPDHFEFGEALYLSQIYQAALTVAGVAYVTAYRFERWGKTPGGELAAAVLRVSGSEVIRLDNDPNFPENGRLELSLEGGQ